MKKKCYYYYYPPTLNSNKITAKNMHRNAIIIIAADLAPFPSAPANAGTYEQSTPSKAAHAIFLS
jgi:hypothetical protein